MMIGDANFSEGEVILIDQIFAIGSPGNISESD